MDYAIIYLAVPVSSRPGEAEPNVDDAIAIGQFFEMVLDKQTPFETIEFLGARLTKNTFAVPALLRIPEE
jgi:hypothetical protein